MILALPAPSSCCAQSWTLPLPPEAFWRERPGATRFYDPHAEDPYAREEARRAYRLDPCADWNDDNYPNRYVKRAVARYRRREQDYGLLGRLWNRWISDDGRYLKQIFLWWPG